MIATAGGPRLTIGFALIALVAATAAAAPLLALCAWGYFKLGELDMAWHLLQTAYVVVPLLLLLAIFGVLVVTATPVYQVPARLRELGDRVMGRHVPAEDEPAEDTTPVRRRRSKTVDDEIDPEMGDPAYDSPVLEGREIGKRGRKSRVATMTDPDTEPTGPVEDAKDVLAAMSRLSPAYTLYRRILQDAERNIRRQIREGEALDAEE